MQIRMASHKYAMRRMACALKAKPLTGRSTEVGWKKKLKMGSITAVTFQKHPLQLRFQFALWTREMVATLIRDKYGYPAGRELGGG